MKKEQSENHIARDLDLPTLIDMVFLLLIFFVVILSPSMGSKAKDPINPTIKHLPKAKLEGADQNRNELKTLTFVIERSEKDGGELFFYVLNPDTLCKFRPPKLSIKEALDITKSFDGYSAPLSDAIRVTQLLKYHIDAYRRAHFTVQGPESEIEILADENAPFWVINEIFQQCQEIKEGEQVILPMISKIVFHVTAGQ